MHADLYDYDGTICPGDTGSAFWLYCLVRRPYILAFLPVQTVGVLCHMFGVDGQFARRMSVYRFLSAIDAEKLSRRFIGKRIRKTYPYFMNRDRTRPVVVCSASPEFLLRPICDALGVQHVIATQVDPKTGILLGKTCKHTEKVRRLNESLPDVVYDNVYSDSIKYDTPILKLGKTAYQIIRGVPKEIQNGL